MKDMEKYLKSAVDCGEAEDNSFDVYGASLSGTDDGPVVIDQRKKMLELESLNLVTDELRTRNGNNVALPKDVTRFRKSFGSILFTGRMCHPFQPRIASSTGCKVQSLLVHHLKDLDSAIKCACANVPVIRMKHRAKYKELF